MLFVPLGIAACALAGALVYVDHRASQRRLQRWEEAAGRLGLRYHGGKDERTIQGRLRGVPVWAHYERRVQVGKNPSAGEKTTLSAGGGDGEIPRELVVRRDSLRLLGGLLPTWDASSGDEDFDRYAQPRTLDEYVCAALSHEARGLLLQLLRQGGEVREGVLLLEDHTGSDHDEGWLEQQLRALARLAAELSVLPSTLHRRLALNARTDPSAGVRLRNLRFLTQPRLCAERELRAATARALLADPDLDIRLLAAGELGPEGFPALREIAADQSLATPARVQALGALGQAGAPGLGLLLAELLSQSDAPELLVAVLTGVATLRLGSLRDAAVRCTEIPHEAVRAAAARTLAKLVESPACRASTEDLLLQLLADPSEDVQHASADALGEIGSARAVEPLLGLSPGLLGRASLRQAARSAITQIQSRLADVEGGRVSLLPGAVDVAVTASGGHGGEVALVKAQAGTVASAPKPRAPD